VSNTPPPFPPYQLTPNLLPVRLPQQGALLSHRMPHPCLHPASGPKLSHMARFWTFDPKAATPGAIECAAPPPLPPHTHHPTTSPFHPALPFTMAHLKLSPSGSVFRLWFQTRYTCTHLSACPTTTTTTSFPTPTNPLHFPHCPFQPAHLKPSPIGSVFRLWPKPAVPAH